MSLVETTTVRNGNACGLVEVRPVTFDARVDLALASSAGDVLDERNLFAIHTTFFQACAAGVQLLSGVEAFERTRWKAAGLERAWAEVDVILSGASSDSSCLDTGGLRRCEDLNVVRLSEAIGHFSKVDCETTEVEGLSSSRTSGDGRQSSGQKHD